MIALANSLSYHLTLCMSSIFKVLLSSADFSKLTFQKNLSETLSECPDHSHLVRSDLGPNCLQRLSADGKLPLARERVEWTQRSWMDKHKGWGGILLNLLLTICTEKGLNSMEFWSF